MNDLVTGLRPSEFEVCVGGCFGPTFTVRLVGARLLYEKSPGMYSLTPAVEINPTPEQWSQFWRRIDRIGVWDWRPLYESHDEEGAHWYVHISINGRTVKSEGENAYPGSDGPLPSKEFEEFLAALRDLLGGVEFW